MTSAIPIVISCPLGAKCEEVKAGAIHRCAWYVHVRGKDKNTNEDLDEWRCSMNWLPTLLIENTFFQRGTVETLGSFRNEMVEANKISQKIMLNNLSTNTKIIEG